jgi:hypothetical protein
MALICFAELEVIYQLAKKIMLVQLKLYGYYLISKCQTLLLKLRKISNCVS